MSDRPVLVCVTGSRALADHADARAWLRAELDRLAPAVVVTGTLPTRDADGEWERATWPDTIAVEWARERDAEAWVFVLDGAVYDAHGNEVALWTDATPPSRTDPARFGWPLTRNAAMIAAAKRPPEAHTRRGPYDVTVLGLRAEWATSHGTEHTLGLARAADLAVVERIFFRAPTLPGFA